MPIFDNYSLKEIEFIAKNISTEKFPDPAIINDECYQVFKK